MTKPTENDVVITVNVPPALEERVVDWLLSRDEATGFTSYAAYGHGASHDRLSVAEQVSGRQRRSEFCVVLNDDRLDPFLVALYSRFAGADVYFYVSPVLRSGHLGALQ